MVESDALDSWDGREGHTTTLVRLFWNYFDCSSQFSPTTKRTDHQFFFFFRFSVFPFFPFWRSFFFFFSFLSFQVGAYLYIFGGVNDETGFEGKNDLLRMSVRPDPTTSKFAWEIVQHGDNNNNKGPTARKGHVAALLLSRFFIIFSGAFFFVFVCLFVLFFRCFVVFCCFVVCYLFVNLVNMKTHCWFILKFCTLSLFPALLPPYYLPGSKLATCVPWHRVSS